MISAGLWHRLNMNIPDWLANSRLRICFGMEGLRYFVLKIRWSRFLVSDWDMEPPPICDALPGLVSVGDLEPRAALPRRIATLRLPLG